MMHSVVLNGEVGRLSQILVSCPEKLFETHPRILDLRHAIPLANRQTELDRPVDYHIGNVNRLQLCVGLPSDVS